MSTTAKILIITGVFLLLMLIMELLRSRYVLGINRRHITLDRLPEAFSGTKIILVSDLHQMRFGEYNEELAKRIKRERPDYILFAGDMGDSVKYNVDAFYELMESLGSDIPLLMVPGNHDLRLGGGDVHKNFAKEVERSGAVLLNNTCAELAKDGQKLYIYGFCQPLEPKDNVPPKKWDFSKPQYDDVCSLIGKCPTDAPTVLLAHDPQPIDAYSEWGAALVLAGHMHGGQVRLPFIGGLFSPTRGFLPKYSAGLYEYADAKMFVTRGLGSTWAPRFLNAPEICVLTLLTLQDEKTAPEEKREPLKPEQMQLSVVKDWLTGEWRSFKDLLNDRLNQLGDFFNLLLGKKRSRFSIAADEKKNKNTYIAPRNRRTHLRREPDLLEKSVEVVERVFNKGDEPEKPAGGQTEQTRAADREYGNNYESGQEPFPATETNEEER